MGDLLAELWRNYSSLWTKTAPASHQLELPEGGVVSATAFTMLLQLIVSVPMNLLILCVIGANKHLHQMSVYCMVFNLVVGALAFQIPFIFGNLYYFFIDRNETICSIVGLVDSIRLTTGAVFYAELAINRYLAFFYDHLFHRWCTPRNTIMLLIFTWVSISGAVLPLWPYMGYESCHFCGLNAAQSKYATYYQATGLGLQAVICLGVLFYCNLKVSRKLKQHQRTLQSRGFKGNATKGATVENVTRLLYFHAMLYPLFVAPAFFARLVPGIENYPWLGRFVGLLVSSEPCITPFLIIHWMRPLKNATRAFLARKFKIFRSNQVADVVTRFDATSQPAQIKAKRSLSTWLSASG